MADRPPAPAPDGQTDGDAPAADGDAGLLRWLARHHGKPFSDAALRASLPSGLDISGPAGIARALAPLGLTSRLVSVAPRRIDPAVLPAVIFRRDGGGPAILAEAISRRRFTVIDPAAPELNLALSGRDLARRFEPRALLVAPVQAAAGSAAARAGGWFWRPVRETWRGWIQVVLAALCINILGLALPLFVMNVYDRVIPNAAFVTLWTLAVGVAIALVLDVALRALRAAVLERIARRVDLRVGAALFAKAMDLRASSRTGGAAGLASTVQEFEPVRDFFGSASFVAVIDLMFVGIFVAALFLVVGPLAWVPLAAIPLVLGLAVVAQAPLRRGAERARGLSIRRHVVLVESLFGIDSVKSVNGEPVMQREWERAIAESSRLSGRTRVWSAFATSGTQLIQQGVSVTIVLLGVYLIAEGRITVGALIAANILAGRVLAPLAAIAQTIFRAHYASTAMAAMKQMMALPGERGATGIASGQSVRAGRVAFAEVSFGYPGAAVPALSDLSFEIAPGETVALLGRVGSGKTTTGKLMNGLLQADRGTILVDGQAVGQYDPAELREGVGYLPQESQLFTGTLRENLALARPGAEDAAMLEALAVAGLAEFVAAQPQGLDLHLGQNGQALSGGQRQGVALARLLLRRTPVLFLDEPTNSMDHQMEAEVIARLRALADGRRTLIFCTHRMSLANLAERFIVLERGRKVLDGPRAEVLAKLRGMPAARLAEA